jgi:hypothetical protein
MFNKIKLIQLYNLWIKTFWMTPFTHSGWNPFKNPFSHVQQNKTHTIIQPLDKNILDDTLQTFWMTPFQKPFLSCSTK